MQFLMKYWYIVSFIVLYIVFLIVEFKSAFKSMKDFFDFIKKN